MKAKKPVRPQPAPKKSSRSPGAEAQFEAFINVRQILIADSSPQTRVALSKLLRSVGARSENIFLAGTYEAAVNEIRRNRPELIICDYHLGNENGLKLIHHQKRESLDESPSLFLLVTAEAGEAAIAEAAEEEIDSYILKPFSIASFREHLLAAAMAKLNPNPYRQCLHEAKFFLSEAKPKPAIEVLERALKLSDSPALAHCYIAQAYLLENQFEKAEAAFRRGLAINPVHYRCLTGLFDLLIERKKRKQAYLMGMLLATAFPLTPSRLADLVTLAIQNENFKDTARLFQLYQEMDYRTPELSQCMSAALIVTGKHFLEKKNQHAAITSFENAITAAARLGRPAEAIETAIETLVDYEEAGQAQRLLDRFPMELRQNRAFLKSEFLLLNATGPIDRILTQGRRLIKRGTHDPKVYEILIKRALQVKLVRAAETLAYEAAGLWPEQRLDFLKLIDGP